MQVFPDSPKQILTKSWLYSCNLSQFYHPICSKQARPAERRNGEVSPARSRTWQVFAPRDCQMWLSTFKFGMFVETCLIFFILYPIQEPYRDPIVRRFWNDSSGTHVWKSHCARAASKSCQRVKYHVALSAKKRNHSVHQLTYACHLCPIERSKVLETIGSKMFQNKLQCSWMWKIWCSYADHWPLRGKKTNRDSPPAACWSLNERQQSNERKLIRSGEITWIQHKIMLFWELVVPIHFFGLLVSPTSLMKCKQHWIWLQLTINPICFPTSTGMIQMMPS